MKTKVGDMYTLTGACQYGETRDGIQIEINPYDTVTKIKDTLSDHMRCRSMYRIGKTGWEIDISNSIIERYFVKEDKDNMCFDFDKTSEEFGIKLPKVKLVESSGKEELFINERSVCCHKHLYPADVLDVLEKHGVINLIKV